MATTFRNNSYDYLIGKNVLYQMKKNILMYFNSGQTYGQLNGFSQKILNTFIFLAITLANI
jgi:hypothetical protein